MQLIRAVESWKNHNLKALPFVATGADSRRTALQRPLIGARLAHHFRQAIGNEHLHSPYPFRPCGQRAPRSAARERARDNSDEHSSPRHSHSPTDSLHLRWGQLPKSRELTRISVPVDESPAGRAVPALEGLRLEEGLLNGMQLFPFCKAFGVLSCEPNFRRSQGRRTPVRNRKDERKGGAGLRDNERADLVGHLAELRARLGRAIAYAAAGMIVVWIFFNPLYTLMIRPIREPLERMGGELTVRGLLEGLLVKCEIALVGGIILAFPLIFYEVWAFIAPGLTRTERRQVRPLVPVSGLLFLLGVAMGYLVTGPSVSVLLRYIPPATSALLTLNETVLLMLKFYLAFGLSFQLPIVLVLLAKVGIVDSEMLARRWREAVVALFLMAAVITPTWDPITMTVVSVPMILLYLGSIGAVKIVERRRPKVDEPDESLAG